MRFSMSILMIFAMLMATACSSGPSDSDIKEAILSSDGTGLLLGNFTVDDLERLAQYEQGGAYSIKLRYKMKTLTSYQEFESAVQKKIEDTKQKGLLGATEAMQYTMLLGIFKSKFGEWEPGTSTQVEREARFAKGDKGWAIVE